MKPYKGNGCSGCSLRQSKCYQKDKLNVPLWIPEAEPGLVDVELEALGQLILLQQQLKE